MPQRVACCVLPGWKSPWVRTSSQDTPGEMTLDRCDGACKTVPGSRVPLPLSRGDATASRNALSSLQYDITDHRTQAEFLSIVSNNQSLDCLT